LLGHDHLVDGQRRVGECLQHWFATVDGDEHVPWADGLPARELILRLAHLARMAGSDPAARRARMHGMPAALIEELGSTVPGQ
jgi:hypothetical protein